MISALPSTKSQQPAKEKINRKMTKRPWVALKKLKKPKALGF